MTNAHLLERVRQLRAEGRSPKQIARTLGLAPAVVSPLIRQIAREATAEAPPSAVLGCWVSPGWRIGLSVARRGRLRSGARWNRRCPGCSPTSSRKGVGMRVLGGHLVPRGQERARAPADERATTSRTQGEVFRRLRCRSGAGTDRTGATPRLGCCRLRPHVGIPHHDLWAAGDHLEPPQGPSAIRFGKDGRPFYVEGPYDDATRNLRTLELSVGRGNFSFEMSVPLGLLDIA
jgi:hypothetical protein